MRAPEFWTHPGGLATLLGPLGALYGASVAFKARRARPYRAGAKVLCVGNLTAGGSGKTPVALTVGARLLARGTQVFFLTRGYGGSEHGPIQVAAGYGAAQVGDEALLLAVAAPTVVARNRAEGARLADACGARAIVMDDGHQNFTLAKDLSLVVVDGEQGFGNRRTIPAGPLREPVGRGLARADAVVVMGKGEPDLGSFRGPVLRAHLTPEESSLRGEHVFAFAGIGRPGKFVASLAEAGAIVEARRFFPDHHVFRRDEIAALRRTAGAARLVTTEKDWVRLPPNEREGIAVLKVRARFEQEAALEALLDRLA